MAAPDPNNPSHRTKAHKLRAARKHGQTLAEVDALWLSDYEEKQQRPPGQSHGRSKSARRVVEHREIEEAAEAEGTGPTAAAAAVGAALQSREEGRRLDSLTEKSVLALKEACGVYKDICLSMAERLQILEQTHIEMLFSVRAHFMAATGAEAALMQRDAETDPAKDMLTMLLAKHLGIPIEGLRAAAALPQPPRPRPRPRPPANGAPTKP